jgi:hypothetical protein
VSLLDHSVPAQRPDLQGKETLNNAVAMSLARRQSIPLLLNALAVGAYSVKMAEID